MWSSTCANHQVDVHWLAGHSGVVVRRCVLLCQCEVQISRGRGCGGEGTARRVCDTVRLDHRLRFGDCRCSQLCGSRVISLDPSRRGNWLVLRICPIGAVVQHTGTLHQALWRYIGAVVERLALLRSLCNRFSSLVEQSKLPQESALVVYLFSSPSLPAL